MLTPSAIESQSLNRNDGPFLKKNSRLKKNIRFISTLIGCPKGLINNSNNVKLTFAEIVVKEKYYSKFKKGIESTMFLGVHHIENNKKFYITLLALAMLTVGLYLSNQFGAENNYKCQAVLSNYPIEWYFINN